jgi:L-alanine-DL-glutamate epimerase-like enolase superfamily enzyme
LETKVRTVTVHTERTFAIARSSADAFERVILEIEDDGLTGRGEAAPTLYYGQDAEGVAAALEGVEIQDPWNIEGCLVENDHLPPTALAALDAALHDLAAKKLGIPLYRLLGLARPESTSAYTLGIATPKTTVEEAKRLSSFPILKMKVGDWEDFDTVQAVTKFSEAEIWVDVSGCA